MHTNHMIDRDGYWQQSGTQPTFINAPQWPKRPCNAPRWFYRVSKKPSVKADLPIHSHIVDASGQCMSISLILGFNLDFSSYDILVGFFVNPITNNPSIFLKRKFPFIPSNIMTVNILSIHYALNINIHTYSLRKWLKLIYITLKT